MNPGKNVKIGQKAGWKWSRLIGKNYLNTGLSAVTDVEDASSNLHVRNMEESVRDAWLNLELSKAYADNLRLKLV